MWFGSCALVANTRSLSPGARALRAKPLWHLAEQHVDVVTKAVLELHVNGAHLASAGIWPHIGTESHAEQLVAKAHGQERLLARDDVEQHARAPTHPRRVIAHKRG